MLEAALVARTRCPVTVDSLTTQLIKLGLTQGDVVLVHSSLSSLGWVNGGAVAVVQALLKAVGENGTIVMPSQTWNITDPAKWMRPEVPDDWIQVIRDTMPVYDARTTPTRGMGQVVEVFRSWPGSIRSHHPCDSFVARGPLAAELMADHHLTDPLGHTSPLGKMYRLDGVKILLIGVDFDKCTALHFAECLRWPDRPKMKEGAPLVVDGKRKWVEYEIPQELDSEKFIPVGASAMEKGLARLGKLGEGRGTIVGFEELVDHAVSIWPDQYPR